MLLNYGHFHESSEDAVTALEELSADIAKRHPDAPWSSYYKTPR